MELTPFFFGLYKFVKYGLYPLTWVVLLLSAATVLALFPFSPKRLRWVRLLVLSSLLLLVTISSPLIAYPADRLARILVPAATADARPIALMRSSSWGEASTRRARFDQPPSRRSYSRNRTTCGVDLYQQGYAPTLVLTGGDGRIFGTGPQEAVEMKRWAVRLGVPDVRH